MVYRGPNRFTHGQRATIGIAVACFFWLFIMYLMQWSPVSPLIKVALAALLLALTIGRQVIMSLERIELKDAVLEARRGLKAVRIDKSDISRVLLPTETENIVLELISGQRVELPNFGGDAEQSQIRDFINLWRKAA